MSGNSIGDRVVRSDAVAKATGAARFVDDLALPGMLHAAVCRSARPHARVVAIDCARAAAVRGVLAVATARDVPGRNVVHIVLDDQPLLADGIVRYAGEPVALAAADDPAAARAAAEAVAVAYEDLPALLDPAESRRSPIRIFGPDNVFAHHPIRKGDVERAFREADVVVEGEYSTPAQEHAYIETQGMLAVPEADGGVTVRGSMQCPFYVQLALCETLGLPRARVRVVQATTGGGFGGKEDVPSLVACHAALLARMTGRPVKLVYARDEDVATTSKRHPARIRCRTGAARDGTLAAAEVEMVYDGGAYATLSPVVLWRAAVHAVGPYRCPAVKVDAYAVATNRVPSGAFRGFGSPQAIFAHESQMDRLAAALGMDPVEIRRRNLLRPGDATATGQVLDDSVGAHETLERAAAAAGWSERRAARPASGARRRGLGVATVFYGSGLGAAGQALDRAGASVQLHADGSVTAAVGTTEMGQGMQTALGQIVAAELGVDPADVTVVETDTGRVPDSGPTVASRATVASGNALQDACRPIRETLRAVAAGLMDVAPESVALASRTATAGSRSVPLGDVVRECVSRRLPLAREGFWVAPAARWDPATGQGDAYSSYAFAAVAADVEVDRETGEVDVRRIVAAHDVGRAINPTCVEGQIEGGTLQGLGWALVEEIASPAGIVENPDLGTYIVPTAADAPRIEAVVVERPWSGGPHGAKGFAEQPLMGVAPAIVNAIADAVGVRICELPAKPERVLAAIRGGSVGPGAPGPRASPAGRTAAQGAARRGRARPAPRILVPRSVDEALEMLARHGESARVLAGGTDLLVRGRGVAARPAVLVSLQALDELRAIREDGGDLVIGPAATHADLACSGPVRSFAPALAEAAASVGSVQIRARGTIGGNLVNASPAADTVPPLVALDALLLLRSASGARTVAVGDFATGPKSTVLRPGELLAEIRLAKCGPAERQVFLKMGQRRALAIAKVSLALRAGTGDGFLRGVRIALGAVAPTVVRARGAEAVLEGVSASALPLDAAVAAVEAGVAPIDDVRSDAAYRRAMCGVLLRRALDR